MPRFAQVQSPDPISTLRSRLRAAEQAASEIVVAVESLRAALRQVEVAVDDRLRPSPRPCGHVTLPPTAVTYLVASRRQDVLILGTPDRD